MLEAGHRVVAISGTLAIAQAGHATGLYDIGREMTVITALVAATFSAGKLSPDCDNSGWIKETFGHRHGVHWFGWPLLAMCAVAYLTGSAPLSVAFVLYGPALGWLFHIWPADWLFGKRGRHIPRGIPLLPYRGSPRTGLNLRVTANNERGGGWLAAKLFGRRKHSLLEFYATLGFAGLAFCQAYLVVSW